MLKRFIAPIITAGLWILLSISLTWAGDAPATLVLMTHDSFDVSRKVIEAFESENHVKLKVLKSGDAGAALNQAILAKGNPLADLFFGVDTTFMSRALKADIFQPYRSPQLAQIPDTLKLDPEYRLLPVDYGDVCLNYDKKWFAEKAIAPPEHLDDLLKPAYKGLTVVENPATSSPGLAFLLTTVGHYGDPGFLDFWKRLRANDVLVTDGWEAAYWSHFSAASDGNRPIVVSYASSPSAEVFYSEKTLSEAPTRAVTSPGAAFRQIEFVGILKGTQQPQLARKLVDFMLSKTFQEDIPLKMFVFPANRSAALPKVFERYAELAKQPVQVDPSAIDTHREQWIEQWTETVLH
jgi:thiamine transport system substrate-binding protein